MPARAGTRPPRRESLDPSGGIRRSKKCALRDQERLACLRLRFTSGTTVVHRRRPVGLAVGPLRSDGCTPMDWLATLT